MTTVTLTFRSDPQDSSFSVSRTYVDVSSSSPQNHPPSVIHWNISSLPPPTIYYCERRNNGMDDFLPVMRTILPEYQVVDMIHVGNQVRAEWTYGGWKIRPTNTYDIFIGTADMLCSSVTGFFLLRTFRGRVVFFSGEDREYPLSMKNYMHYFGPVVNGSERDHRMYYFQFVWWSRLFQYLPPKSMIDGTMRPKGQKLHFLVYAASNCVGFREEAFVRLSGLGSSHYAGKCKGNVAHENITKIDSKVGVNNWVDNIGLYQTYRFCLVMEHTGNHLGYITEKILMAFAAGCIPIYYGPSSVFDIFNNRSFIFYNITDPEPSIQLVVELEEKRYLYNNMLNEPILAEGDKSIEKYFSLNNTIGGGRLKYTLRKKLGLENFVP